MASKSTKAPLEITKAEARAIWLAAQRLDEPAPFGSGPEAAANAIAHLGYVQIDTINVIERSHHHILFNRIPDYRRADLHHAQSEAKTVFEYWTHALSYVHINDFPYFAATMKAYRREPSKWLAHVTPYQRQKVMRRIRSEGALAISDIKDDRLVDKDHPWASRKPSKSALQAGFYNGELVISRRDGMLKTYELTERHFGWDNFPKPATANQILAYKKDRALRSQGLISLDSACYLIPSEKPQMLALIEKDVRAKRLVPVRIEGMNTLYWARPETLENIPKPSSLTHILSPFDPLIIQRKRTAAFFEYDHIFEVYIPKEKRLFGYFTLPVLFGDEIIAAIDLKADRQAQKLLIQAWHWIGKGNEKDHKALIETELDRFAKFQFGD